MMARKIHEPGGKAVENATRWARYKDAVKSYPETVALATAAISSSAALVASQPPNAAFGTAMLAIPATGFAFYREKYLYKALTRAERIVSSVISNAGLVAGMALFIGGRHAVGAAVAMGSLLATNIYEPLKQFVKSPATIRQKTGIAVTAALSGGGILAVAASANVGGLNLTFDVLGFSFRMPHTIAAPVDLAVMFGGMITAVVSAALFTRLSDRVNQEQTRAAE